MTRAVGICVADDGSQSVEMVDLTVRAPGPDEVRIAVRAAAVNPTDLISRPSPTDIPGPWIPGMDAAGVVETVGPNVTRLAVGEKVMAVVSHRRPEGGAQAELVVVPAASVVPLPNGVSFEEAATLPMNGLTAQLGLSRLGLEPGATLAVTGAAGVLGSYVTVLAKDAGLRVVADARPEDEELVWSFGADLIVPRGERYVPCVRAAVPEGVDGLYDAATLRDAAFGALRDGAAMISVRRWDPDSTERGIESRFIRVTDAIENTSWLDRLSELASFGRLPLRVAATFPIERAADARKMMAAGGIRGRAVITF